MVKNGTAKWSKRNEKEISLRETGEYVTLFISFGWYIVFNGYCLIDLQRNEMGTKKNEFS